MIREVLGGFSFPPGRGVRIRNVGGKGMLKKNIDERVLCALPEGDRLLENMYEKGCL